MGRDFIGNDVDLERVKVELIESIVYQNYWDGHDPHIIGNYPDVFLVIGKIDDAYNRIINPVIEDIRNQTWDKYEFIRTEPCPLSLKVIEIDVSGGPRNLKTRDIVAPTQSNDDMITLYIIKPYDAIMAMGEEMVKDFQRFVFSLMGVAFPADNDRHTHAIILSETDPEPENYLNWFISDGILQEIVLKEVNNNE